MLSRMDSFALSERWNGWTDLDVMVQAARAAIAAGPLDPLLCAVTVEWDFDDDTTLDGLDELQKLLDGGAEPLALDIWVAQIVEAQANLRLVFNGRWLQIYGAGSDWTRAKAAYDAAQVEISLVAGITTFKLPKLPADTVNVVRKRVGAKDRDPGRLGGDEQPPSPGV
ncbi:MAG: hypothetical protein QOJ35_1466 [Solirubrobacteraceae bacterium]|jgi:hypothetical protein|nr:hypothetical protein [Solirubrobacteraceae bacterium]